MSGDQHRWLCRVVGLAGNNDNKEVGWLRDGVRVSVCGVPEECEKM